MSLERFKEQYQPGPELVQQVSSEQRMMENMDPPLIFLLDGLISDSSLAVKAISDKFEMGTDGDGIDLLFDECHEDIIAVVVGNSIKGLMELQEEDGSLIFDNKTLLEKLNNSFAGTPLARFKRTDVPDAGCDVLDTETSSKFKAEVEKDPTLSFSFKNPELLPPNLRAFLSQHHILEYRGLGNLLSAWEDIAKHVAVKDSTKALVPSGQTSETSYDLIADIEAVLKEAQVSVKEGGL